MTQKTPEQLADDRRRDVMAFAYRDKDGQLYTIDADGDRVRAPADAKALSPEYQKVADQTAALVMMYNKVLAVEPEQRGILSSLMQGKKDADKSLSAAGHRAWDEIKRTADDAGINFDIPGAGLVRGVGSIGDGFSAVPAFLSELKTATGDIWKQFGGDQISRENALAIGTAYASARQVAASGRPSEPGLQDFFSGLFSKNFGAYLGAIMHWAVDKVMGAFGMEKSSWHQDLTLAQHIEQSMRGNDNEQVQHEMGKLKKIGGVDTADLAIITRGGIVRDASGKDTTIAPADRTNAAASVTGPDAANQPVTPDAAAAERKKVEKPLTERLSAAATNSDFSESSEKAQSAGPVGLILGGGAALAVGATTINNGAKGFVRGATAHVETPSAATAAAKAWAEKPVGGGWWNLAGKTAVGLGNATGRVFVKSVNAVLGVIPGAQDFTFGTVKGVAETLGDAATASSSKLESLGKFTGKLGSHVQLVAPVVPVVQTLNDMGHGDTGGSLIHGSEATAIGVGLFKLGAKRAIPGIAPVISGAEFVNAARKGDGRGMVTSSTELATIGGFAATGGAMGAWGFTLGPVGFATVPAGAAVGAVVGGIASIFTGWGAGKIYDRHATPSIPQETPASMTAQAQAKTGALPADPALAAAGVDATERARTAQAAATSQVARKGFAVSNVTLGAVPAPDAGVSLSGVHSQIPSPVIG